MIVASRAKVATNSPSRMPPPARIFVPASNGGIANIRWASSVPQMPPASWHGT
jgi:hypothetical protein